MNEEYIQIEKQILSAWSLSNSDASAALVKCRRISEKLIQIHLEREGVPSGKGMIENIQKLQKNCDVDDSIIRVIRSTMEFGNMGAHAPIDTENDWGKIAKVCARMCLIVLDYTKSIEGISGCLLEKTVEKPSTFLPCSYCGKPISEDCFDIHPNHADRRKEFELVMHW